LKRAFICLGILLVAVFGVSALADTQETSSSSGATLFAGDFYNGYVSLFVSNDTFTFESDDGPGVTRQGTMLSVYYSSPDYWFNGCFLIRDQDFTLDPELHTAELHTTLSGTGNCYGILRSDGQPLVSEAIAGPGPPFPGYPPLAANLRVDIRWEYAGAVGQSTYTSTDQCEAFSLQSQSSGRYAYSGVTGRVASVSRYASAADLRASGVRNAQLSSRQSKTNRNGLRPSICGFFGKG
jgi:hypothetical protein